VLCKILTGSSDHFFLQDEDQARILAQFIQRIDSKGLDKVFKVYTHEEFDSIDPLSIPYGEKFIVVKAKQETPPAEEHAGFTLKNLKLLGNLDALRDCQGVPF
jgi:hypothetical protein